MHIFIPYIGSIYYIFMGLRLAPCRQSEVLDPVIPRYYHRAMKVAISLPDDVFAEAELLASRQGVSRSQLYVQALEEYLEKRKGSRVTEQLDAVYATGQEPLDPGLAAAQQGAIGREAW